MSTEAKPIRHIAPYPVPPNKRGKWGVRFSDITGAPRTISCADNKENAAAIAEHIGKILHRRNAGKSLDIEQSDWIDGIMPDLHAKLVRFGVVAGQTLVAKTGLAQHIERFVATIAQKNRPRRAEEVALILSEFASRGNIQTLTALDFESAEATAYRLLNGDDDHRPMAPLTVRKHLQIVGQFCKWAVQTKLLKFHPLAVLPAIEGGVQQEKKALNIEEQRELLVYTARAPVMVWHNKDGGVRVSIDGDERRVIYAVNFGTGLRANEIRQLTAASFLLDREDDEGMPAPAVHIPKRTHKSKPGTGTKNAERGLCPLAPDIAALVKGHLRQKHPQAPAFTLPATDELAEMVRRDMAQARRAWIDKAKNPAERSRRERSTFLAEYDELGRRAGFHGMRTSFATTVCRLESVSDMEVAERVRHHDPKTTKDHYLKGDARAGREFAAKLPALIGPRTSAVAV